MLVRKSKWLALVVLISALVSIVTAMLTSGGPGARSRALAALGTKPAIANSDTSTRQVAARSASLLQTRRVFVVGDSLTVGTEPWLRADISRRSWTLTGVDARVGRPVAEGLSVLRQRGPQLPSTVVIALGTNNLGASSQAVAGWLRQARAIAGNRRIIWVNLCLSPAVPRLGSYRALNTLLAKLAPRHGVQVANWCAYALAHHISPGPDGIHYGPAGYQRRAAFYASVIAPG
jgi:lysophospholipase L1-like esterase